MEIEWSRPPQMLRISIGEVHVWRANLDLPPEPVDHYKGLLSADERAKAERFLRDVHRTRFVVARGTLRALLGRYLGVDPRQIGFVYGPHGKPELKMSYSATRLRFNVSHSHDCVLLAFTVNREIGVDLERVVPMPDTDQIARRFFSRHEGAVLHDCPPGEKVMAFFTCWARKEAVVKAIGDGLAIPLDSFDVMHTPAKPSRLVRGMGNLDTPVQWYLHDLPTIPGYASALATEGTAWQLQCWEWTH